MSDDGESSTKDDVKEKLKQEVDSAELAKKRQGYYDQWRNLAKEATTKTKEEEEAEAKAAAEKLGLAKDAPKSEAERKDREKREALKEAKKLWDGKKAMEESQIFKLTNQTGVTKVIKKEDINHAPVLRITGCKNCKFTLNEETASLIKLFVDDCEDCEIILKCLIITQHVEISHSNNMTVTVARPTEIIQLDLIDGMIIRYNQNCFLEGNKIYHAGVKRLEVHHFDLEEKALHDYTNIEEEDKTFANPRAS